MSWVKFDVDIDTRSIHYSNIRQRSKPEHLPMHHITTSLNDNANNNIISISKIILVSK